MRNKLFNHAVHILILGLATGFLIPALYESLVYLPVVKNIGIMISVVLLTCIVYIIKSLRFYLIILERRIAFKRYFSIFLRTTFVNLLLPFKTGELYRIYSYGHEMGSYKVAFLSAMIERYFDTVPLLLLLISFTIMVRSDILIIVVLLFAFVVFMSVLYVIFPSVFRYLNRFFIEQTNSKTGIIGLRILDEIQFWYNQIQDLMKGRVILLLVFSSITWTIEYGILSLLVKGAGEVFHISMFIDYMNSILMGIANKYLNLFIGISSLLLAASYICVYLLSGKKRRIS